jgi:hypothetical protein
VTKEERGRPRSDLSPVKKRERPRILDERTIVVRVRDADVLVDPEAYDRVVARHVYTYWRSGDRPVIFRNLPPRAPFTKQLLTHDVVGVFEKGWTVRHRNGNPLDCRRENLVASVGGFREDARFSRSPFVARMRISGHVVHVSCRSEDGARWALGELLHLKRLCERKGIAGRALIEYLVDREVRGL